MKLSLGIELSADNYDQMMPIINELSSSLENEFVSIDYGESIKEFFIGLICVHPQFDPFCKAKRPKYTDYKTTKFDGWIPTVIEKTFECEIKLDYEKVLEATEEEVKKIVAQSIMDYLHELKMPKKVTDFDKAKFIADLETFFRREQLID